MSRIINPYSLLGNASPDGVWTYTGTGSAPVAPPEEYDDDMDFTEIDHGIYEYTYTVNNGTCSDSKVLNITLRSQSTWHNSDCDSAKTLFFPYGGGHYTHTGDYLDSRCPGYETPEMSDVDIPAEWGSGPFAGDLWYTIHYTPTSNPLGAFPILMAITISSENLPTNERIKNPVIALYTDCNTELVSGYPVNENEATVIVSDMFATSFTLYVRVSCPQGDEGAFQIEVTV